MRAPAAWKVATQSRSASGPTSLATRDLSSPAALLVNVTARISPGRAFRSRKRWAMRWVRTRVFPLPAPARMRSGPSPCVAAASCSGLSNFPNASTKIACNTPARLPPRAKASSRCAKFRAVSEPASVRLVPLGGLGEVGMNCLAVDTPEARLVVDCGVLFPGGEAALGVEIITPDLSYLRIPGPPVEAVLLTHAHEDHVGALPYLLREHPDAAVCGTRYTLAVGEEKLGEDGISPRLVELSPRASARVGGMEVEPLQVTHSIPDAVGYALRTPAGMVVHTGDFKVDWSPPDGRLLDVRRFAELGEEGVACLLSDSTNAEREGTSASESQVGEAMARIFGAPYARG